MSTNNTNPLSVLTASTGLDWQVTFASTNLGQRDIVSCHETSALTINNGGRVSSP